MTTTAQRHDAPPRRGWRVPAGLVALAVVPVVAGAFRLVELGGGTGVAPGDGRLGPLVAHIVTAAGYAVLGAFQFAPRFRARRRGWHRVAGRLVVLCGLAGALSGLWLTLSGPDVGDLLSGIRLVFGTAWAAFLVLGFAAIRRRDPARHREWMIRAYAVGTGAGTQVFTLALWALAVGAPDRRAEALMMLAGWVVNVVVAEWAVRRSRRPVPNTRPLEAR